MAQAEEVAVQLLRLLPTARLAVKAGLEAVVAAAVVVAAIRALAARVASVVMAIAL